MPCGQGVYIDYVWFRVGRTVGRVAKFSTFSQLSERQNDFSALLADRITTVIGS